MIDDHSLSHLASFHAVFIERLLPHDGFDFAMAPSFLGDRKKHVGIAVLVLIAFIIMMFKLFGPDRKLPACSR